MNRNPSSSSNQSLITQLLRPNPKNARHYAFLTRQNECEGERVTYHKYFLKGLISPDTFISDIYLLFFPSFYKKQVPLLLVTICQPQDRLALKRKNISRFYSVFLRQVYLHALLGKQSNRTDELVDLVNDIVSPQNLDRDLAVITQGLISELKKQLDPQFKKDSSSEKVRSYEMIRQVRIEMKKGISKLLSEMKQNLFEFEEREMLPENLKGKMSLLYVQRCFKRLSKLYVLFRGRKMKQIQQLAANMNIYSPIKISLQKKSQKIECIKIAPLTSESQPVLTSLRKYLVYRHVNQFGKNTTVHALIKDVSSKCREFYKLTRRVYPLISVEDIIFDQKSLKPVLSPIGVLYDALGIHRGNAGSVELEMAANCTPAQVDFQKCWLEFEEGAQWALIRKYFYMIRQKKEGEEERKRIRDDQYDDEDEEEAIQRLEGCPFKRSATEQKVHVWRLISIFYFIARDGKHLIRDYYNQVYAHQCKKDAMPTFEINRYKKVLKELYDKIQEDSNRILRLLSIEKDGAISMTRSISEGVTDQFDFKFKELEKVLRMEAQEDSLLERMQFEKAKSQLWMRTQLCRQIVDIISNSAYFKRLLNVKKHLILFFVNIMEYAFDAVFSIEQTEGKPKKRKSLTNELKEAKQFKTINFKKEKGRKRSSINSAFKKLNEYYGRNDENNAYLKNKTQLRGVINALNENIDKLSKQQQKLGELQGSVKLLDKASEEAIELRYIEGITRVKTVAKESFNASSEYLEELMRIDLQTRLQRPQELHKIDAKNKELFLFITKKFYFMIKTLLTLNAGNWRKYQTFILPNLLQAKALGINKIEPKLEELKPEAIQLLNTKMTSAAEILSRVPIFRMEEGKDPVLVEKARRSNEE